MWRMGGGDGLVKHRMIHLILLMQKIVPTTWNRFFKFVLLSSQGIVPESYSKDWKSHSFSIEPGISLQDILGVKILVRIPCAGCQCQSEG